jgi:hypothetical protein
MAANRRKEIPADSLLQLRQRLDRLPRKRGLTIFGTIMESFP